MSTKVYLVMASFVKIELGNFDFLRKFISGRPFYIGYLTWNIFGVRSLNVVQQSVCEFSDNQRKEDHRFLTGVNEIYVCAVKPFVI
jgi:hypothetical protein